MIIRKLTVDDLAGREQHPELDFDGRDVVVDFSRHRRRDWHQRGGAPGKHDHLHLDGDECDGRRHRVRDGDPFLAESHPNSNPDLNANPRSAADD